MYCKLRLFKCAVWIKLTGLSIKILCKDSFPIRKRSQNYWHWLSISYSIGRKHDVILIHWERIKTVAILQTTISNAFPRKKCRILIHISLMFVPEDPIDNKASLVQVMTCHRIGDKPLPEPMMTQFTDTYMCWQWYTISPLGYLGHDGAPTTTSGAHAQTAGREFGCYELSLAVSVEPRPFVHTCRWVSCYSQPSSYWNYFREHTICIHIFQ